MNTVYTIIIIVQVLSALAIIGLVLLQHGKGADMGAAFGSGASGSLFGATGSSNFLSKSTAIAAIVFFTATLTMAYVGNKRTGGDGGVMENLQTAPAVTQPQPAPAPAPAPAPGGSFVPGESAPSGVPGKTGQIPK